MNAIRCSEPAWRQWLARMDCQMARFTAVTIPHLPQPYWSDRATDRVCGEFPIFFPSSDSVLDPARFDTVDLFVRWVGQTSVHRAGMQWFSHPHAGGGLYRGFGPALCDPLRNGPTAYALEILEWAAQDGLNRMRELITA